MKRHIGFAVLFSFCFSAQAAYRAHYKIDPQGKKTLSSVSQIPGEGSSRLLRSLPYYIGHGPSDLAYHYEEREFTDASAPLEVRALAKKTSLAVLDFNSASTEMRVIREQGPAQNRINLTVIGDGYTLSEKSKFFSDVERTVKGLFETKTFESYLPLFNVYAVFVASAQSGIGDGRSKNTAFGLYRSPAGSKRAIMPGNESAMSRAIALAPATDYPIVLANDDYYGGLGGRWAISTSSESSGLIVLRHELGHNFGEVGEEYDNGYVYSGANASRSSNVSWQHWIEGALEVHEAKLLSGDYAWKNLSDGDYTAKFQIPKGMKKLLLELSTVGWSKPDEVAVTLNSQALNYDGVFHKDRSFFNLSPIAVSSGASYELKISERVKDGDNVLGFALAYTMPEDYNFTEGKVGAYASYDAYGRKSYRPTHASCLMKDMRLEHFCSVDYENMWLKFLDRVSLIDDVKVNRSGSGTEVTLEAPAINHLSIRWFRKNGSSWTELGELNGLRKWQGDNLAGQYRVTISLRSEEVRVNSSKLEDSKDFTL